MSPDWVGMLIAAVAFIVLPILMTFIPLPSDERQDHADD